MSKKKESSFINVNRYLKNKTTLKDIRQKIKAKSWTYKKSIACQSQSSVMKRIFSRKLILTVRLTRLTMKSSWIILKKSL